MAQYVELHARSAFSFLEGASLPEALAEVCAERGLGACALLDRDGVYGAARFHLAAQKMGMRAHIGAEVTVQVSSFKFQVSSEPAATRNSKLETRNFFRLPLLAANRTGYQNLCRLITRMKLRAPKIALDSHPETTAAATREELADFSSGLICLTGGAEGPLHAALREGGAEAARAAMEQLVAIFGRENLYVELQRHYGREEEAFNHAALTIARALGLRVVATNGVQHATADGREVLDVFTAIRRRTTLDDAGRLLAR